MSQPVVFAAPARVELDSNPVCPDWIIEGTPQARAKCLARSADGTSSIMAWSCTPGCFEWYYAVDETVHIIHGEVFVTDEEGRIHRLGPGDMAFFPAGSRSIWPVTKECENSPCAATACRDRSASCCEPGTRSSIA